MVGFLGRVTFVITKARRLDQAQEWMEIGFNVISYGGDMRVHLKALTEGVAGVRKLAAGG